MLDKNFLRSDIGKKHVIAYVLHVHYNVYHKDIANYYGCASTTIGKWVNSLKKYSYLKEFTSLTKLYDEEIQTILSIIQNYDR